MLTAAMFKALQVYGIAIVISMLVALLIKGMVMAGARLEKKAPPSAMPLGTVCPIDRGIPDEDVAALSAAIFAMIGAHRILHIAPTAHGWTSGGRATQHTHTPRPR